MYVTDAAKIADYQAMAIQPTKNNGMYYGISDKSLREIVNPLASIANTYGEGTTVITSYSIHYTKLYDQVHDSLVRR